MHSKPTDNLLKAIVITAAAARLFSSLLIHIGRPTGNSNPVMTSSAGPVPRVVQTTDFMHGPSLYCPIANSASAQSKQPV